MPYAEIAPVTIKQEPGICTKWSTASKLGNVSPGCGCDEETVNRIYSEMSNRQKAHGDAGQTKLGLYAVDYMKTLTEVDPKVDAKAAVTGAVYFTQGRVRGRV